MFSTKLLISTSFAFLNLGQGVVDNPDHKPVGCKNYGACAEGALGTDRKCRRECGGFLGLICREVCDPDYWTCGDCVCMVGYSGSRCGNGKLML